MSLETKSPQKRSWREVTGYKIRIKLMGNTDRKVASVSLILNSLSFEGPVVVSSWEVGGDRHWPKKENGREAWSRSQCDLS